MTYYCLALARRNAIFIAKPFAAGSRWFTMIWAVEGYVSSFFPLSVCKK
jgi:hypothetical protein